MNSRQRVEAALNHQQPDHVPLDLGASAVTGMHVSSVCKLRQSLGLDKPGTPVKVVEPYQMLGEIAPDLQDALGVDVVGLGGPTTMFGFEYKNWRPWTTFDGTPVLVPGGFNTDPEPNGDIFMYPEGDKSVPPSGRMPKGGFYFDSITRQEPIDDDKLNVEDNLEEFAPISDEDLNHFKAEAARLKKSERSVVATFGGTAFGDIALVPGPFLKRPRGIRDVTEWYMSTVTSQDYIHKIFSAQCETALKNLAKIHEIVRDLPQAVFVCGTDFGTQDSQFCSARTFDSLYAPYYKKVNDWIHKNTAWKTFKHCCGSVEVFMSRFIASGFDVINPVQISAKGMDPKLLKEKYGDQLVFWGGGVDTQKTLPFGTPEQVREEVLKQCEIFSGNGGFVFNSVHNIQANVPVENIAAMIDAVKDFNGEK